MVAWWNGDGNDYVDEDECLSINRIEGDVIFATAVTGSAVYHLDKRATEILTSPDCKCNSMLISCGIPTRHAVKNANGEVTCSWASPTAQVKTSPSPKQDEPKRIL